LRLEVAAEILRFLPAERLIEADEHIRDTEVAVVLRDFVFQDGVIAEGVPGEIREHAVVLMAVVAEVSEHEVRLERALDALELLFDLLHARREVAVAELLHDDGRLGGAGEEGRGAVAGLVRAAA